MKKKILRLILGDQLNHHHSWFSQINDHVTYVMMEVRSETDYATHHIQKVAGFFAAMRSFAAELIEKKHHLIYFKLTDVNNLQSFEANCNLLISEHGITRLEYLLPDEHRLDNLLKLYCSQLDIDSYAFDTEHFYTSRQELCNLFKNKSTYLMETFYRYMRKKHQVLMIENDKPMNGKWNFDVDNRNKLPKGHNPISPLAFNNDVTEIVKQITASQIKTIGSIDESNFLWPVNREQTNNLLSFFLENCLKYFGTYQDAMAPNHWSIYHSRISFAMNIKLISPKEVVDAVVLHYNTNHSEIEYHQVEGFIRQIIGWREYMRGIYWLKMPEYATLNFFENKNSLPEWFWTGKTKMNCMRSAIQQSLQYAYAHHIQRLMVTGNFALLAGVNPDEVDSWYLGIYIDAIEWVEITNTRGMSQFADGGIVGTKPYVSSAAYIHKMSSYCDGCFYDYKKKTGEKACPFNSLYWNFYDQHESKLAKNPRIGMMYNVWRRMERQDKTALLEQASYYLKNIHQL